MTTVSVIVPVYNVESYLERGVMSIVAQTYTDLEIILVNDGSTDRSGVLCDQLAERDARIKVVHKDNGGLSDARNIGMANSKGEWILFIDSDDYIDTNMVTVLLDLAIQQQALVSICNITNVYVTGEKPQFMDATFRAVYNRSECMREYFLGEKVPGSICNKLIHRSLALQCSFPIDKTYEDAFYQFQLFQLTDRFAVTGEAFYYYYHRSDSITTRPFDEQSLDVIEIYQRYYDWAVSNDSILETEAFFRLAYSYFVVFDRLLLLANYQHHPKYQMILKWLRQHSKRIIRLPYFKLTRRLSAITLKYSVSIYRYLLLKDQQHHKGVSES